MEISKISRVPLSVEVAARLREAVLDGTLPPGTELPTEQDLARSFAVGRSTIREALRVLQSQGLITGSEAVSTNRPKVSYERTADSAATALSTALRVGAIPLEDLVKLRVLLESEAVRHVERLPEEVHAALTTMEAAAAESDHEAFHMADVNFHVALAQASGNKALGMVIAVLRDCIASYLLQSLSEVDNVGATLSTLLDEHRRIVDAVESGEREVAAAQISLHIHNFYKR